MIASILNLGIFYLWSCTYGSAFLVSQSSSDLTRQRHWPLQTSTLRLLPNPFQSSDGSSPSPGQGGFEDSGDDGLEFEASSMGLIRQARRLLASDYGILDPALLDDSEFIWIGPFVDQPLGKIEYLAAGRFFDLRAAFPDLDYRPHDFRIDESDPYTIRISCRVTGTMRGALRLRTGTFPPTGNRMKCPPESATITFNKFGKVTKLCTGFCMDRQVGNTKGGTGVIAAALVAGQPPSDWDLYPAPAVIKRFFGRPIEPILETKAVLAPFPETVMIQLAKGILATNMASDDPTLLSDKFEFLTPFKGPIRKNEFLQSCAMEEFEGVNPSFSHFRVDPYDPVRVWVDVLPSGNGYQGCPQAMSFAFDEEGFCDRITSSFVMDPSIGNGGGLGGPEGYKYATGQASLDILTRPWARVVGRARKQVLAPLTGVGVDDYVTPEQAKAKESAPSGSLSIESVQQSGMLQSKPVENLSELRASSEISVPKAPQLPTTPPPPAVVEKQSEIIERQAKATEEEARLKRQGADEAKLLIAEVEEAEKRALEARIKLAKLEAERAESERRLKEAQAQRAARMVELEQEKIAAAEARQAKQDQLRNKAEQTSKAVAQSPPMNSVANPVESAAEKARALLAEVNAKRAAKLETDRAAAEKRSKEMEKKRKSQAEEKQKKQEVERALLAKKKAESDAKRAAAAEAKRKQAEKLKADIEKKTAMKRAQSLMSSQKTAQNLKAQTAEKRRKQEAQRAEMLRKKQEAQRERVATAAAAANKKKLGTAPARSAEKKKGTIRSKTGEGSDDVKEAELKAKRIQDAEAAKERQRAALEALQNAVSRATVSLFGLAGGQPKANEEEEKQSPFAAQAKTPSGAPKGVPVLKRWRKTKDGAITGMVYGSSSFSDGDRVTTSPIAFGKVSKGEVVKTGSGSKYYLS